MSVAPSLYVLLFIITAAFVDFSAGRHLGRILHPSGLTPKNTTEFRNASRYCGNGFYLYLSKQVDTADPKDEDQWNREYANRVCTTRVIESVIQINHTKYFENKGENMTWGASFKLNNTHYYLISEFFDQEEDEESETESSDVIPYRQKNKKWNADIPSTSTLDPESLMGLRRFFIKCKPNACPFFKDAPIAYNIMVGFDNGDMQQQFVLRKNILLDENRHLITKHSMHYDDNTVPVVAKDEIKYEATYCPPGCVPEEQIRKTRHNVPMMPVEEASKDNTAAKGAASAVTTSAATVLIPLLFLMSFQIL